MPSTHVIFDCDGVLVDSEPLANEVLAGFLEGLGVSLSLEQLERRFTGLTDAAMWVEIEREWGVQQPADFDRRYWETLSAVFDQRLRPIPGILDVLASLRIPASVASNSSLQRVRHALALTRLAPYFQGRVHSAQQVARPKPAPDLYLHAASAAGEEAGQCLVIEDSASGIRAARAAGMMVIGFTGGSHCGPGHAEKLKAAGALATFAHYWELAALMDAL